LPHFFFFFFCFVHLSGGCLTVAYRDGLVSGYQAFSCALLPTLKTAEGDLC